MRVFVTGATGFIGSALIHELVKSGHQVVGLTRSEAGAEALANAGAEAHRGDLDDLDSLREGASKADGVIHTAFNHDFSRYQESCEADRHVIEALGSVLAGSDRPLIITSGTGMAAVVPGQLATEDLGPASSAIVPRAASEEAAAAEMAKDVSISVVRLPQVHDRAKQGLITYLIELAREKAVSAYVGEGLNRWPAAHVTDTAHLYRLALEKNAPGSRYHAVAEEGVQLRVISEVIGKQLNIPLLSIPREEAAAHFGWLAGFVGLDLAASSAHTREALGWIPTGPRLLEDLQHLR